MIKRFPRHSCGGRNPGSSEELRTPVFARGDHLKSFGAILKSTAFRNRISEKEY